MRITNKKKAIVAAILCAVMIGVSGVAFAMNKSSSDKISTSTGSAEAKTDEMFTKSDMDGSYDTKNATKIILNNGDITVDGENVNVDGNRVEITDEGTYIVSGTINEGQIVVNGDNRDKIKIVLKNANITAKDTAALYVKQADKVFLTIAEGTTNKLQSGGTFQADGDNNVDGVIFSKDDLTINGSGSLDISTSSGNGVVSKDDLVVVDTDLNIDVSEKALEGKDSVRIASGDIDIKAGDDGIHSDNEEEAGLGFVYIKDGTLNISAGDDAIKGISNVSINGGNVKVSSSYEGIEALTVDINGGDVSIESSDDGINAASSSSTDEMSNDTSAYISIAGGKTYINAEGDGIDSNGSLEISGGEVYVDGPAQRGNGAIDYNGEGKITGGILIATDSGGMTQSLGSSSTQGVISLGAAGSGNVSIKDSSGNVLATFTPTKSYGAVVVSTPDIKQGNTYTLEAGGNSQSIEMTSLIYGTAGHEGGPGGAGFPQQKGPR